MKTAFERNDYRFEPQGIVTYSFHGGKPKLVRQWAVYQLHKSGHWIRLGTRFYAPRTPKKDIV